MTKERIAEIVHGNVLAMEDPVQRQRRCGLCCVLLPTKTFSKGGAVCQFLQFGHQGYSCQIYERRPDECRRFSCNQIIMHELMEWFILDAISGKKEVVYYRESSGEYDSESVENSLRKMQELEMIEQSQVYRTIRDGRGLNVWTIPVLWALREAQVNMVGNNQGVMEILGIASFWKRIDDPAI